MGVAGIVEDSHDQMPAPRLTGTGPRQRRFRRTAVTGLVRQSDDVIAVGDEGRVRQPVAHALRERGRQVDGDVRDPRPRSSQLPAESTKPVCQRSQVRPHLPVLASRVQTGLPRLVSSIPSTVTGGSGAASGGSTRALNALWTVAHPTP